MKESPGPLRTFPNYPVVRNRHCCTVPGFSYLSITVVTGGWRAAPVPGEGEPFWSLVCPAFGFDSAPYPPLPPSPAGKGGKFLVCFAGGSAPGTPALNRLRHLQILPYRCLAGSWLFLRHGFPPPRQRPKTRFPTGNASAAPVQPPGMQGAKPLI